MTPTPQIVHQLVDNNALPDDTAWAVIRLREKPCILVVIKRSAVCAEVLGEVWSACLQIEPRLALSIAA